MIHAEPWVEKTPYAFALDRTGLSRTTARRYQQLAAVPDDVFEDALRDPMARKPTTRGLSAHERDSQKRHYLPTKGDHRMKAIQERHQPYTLRTLGATLVKANIPDSAIRQPLRALAEATISEALELEKAASDALVTGTVSSHDWRDRFRRSLASFSENLTRRTVQLRQHQNQLDAEARQGLLSRAEESLRRESLVAAGVPVEMSKTLVARAMRLVQ